MFYENRVVNLIKLDIQGYELPALKGAKETLKRYKPIIICELMDNKEDVKKFLNNLGYEEIYSFKKDKIFKFAK